MDPPEPSPTSTSPSTSSTSTWTEAEREEISELDESEQIQQIYDFLKFREAQFDLKIIDPDGLARKIASLTMGDLKNMKT